jgi:hypothetical protein
MTPSTILDLNNQPKNLHYQESVFFVDLKAGYIPTVCCVECDEAEIKVCSVET